MQAVSHVKDHGVFQRYTPQETPPGYEGIDISTVEFAQNEDGEDFYETIYANGTAATNHHFALVEPDSGRVVSITDDPDGMSPPGRTRLGSPNGFRVLELTGVPEGVNLDGWTWNGAKSFAPPPDDSIPTTVPATQAKIQLYRTKRNGTDLLTMTEALVGASGDRELQLWFNGTQNWRIDNPHVQNIGAYFGLSPEQIQAMFTAASQIEA